MRHMLGRPRARLGVVLAAAVVVLGVASGAWALIGGGTPPATFMVQLDGETIATAKAYDLDGHLVNPGKNNQYREYTLTLTLALRDNPAPAQAFANGQTFASARVVLLANDLSILKTYELANATVDAYRQSGSAATNTFDQQLVLTSRSLAIS